jgi:hypothetical protein
MAEARKAAVQAWVADRVVTLWANEAAAVSLVTRARAVISITVIVIDSHEAAAIMGALLSAIMITGMTLTTVAATGSSVMAYGSGSTALTIMRTVMTVGGCSIGLRSPEARIGGAAITTASAITKRRS